MRYVVLALLTVSGCAATLTEAGNHVQVMKADPPAGCQEAGAVSGTDPDPRIQLRNEAGKLGANYVRLETVDSYHTEKGTAYKCPPEVSGK